MKEKLLLLLALSCLSFSVKAKFFETESFGIKSQAGIIFSPIKKGVAKPQFVFAKGEYHNFTCNEFPFYTPHFGNEIWANSLKNVNKQPLGSLWLKSIAESKFYAGIWNKQSKWALPEVNSLAPSLARPANKLCKDCYFKKTKCSDSFHALFDNF